MSYSVRLIFKFSEIIDLTQVKAKDKIGSELWSIRINNEVVALEA